MKFYNLFPYLIFLFFLMNCSTTKFSSDQSKPLLLIIHGGPGLDDSYLKESFSKFKTRDLVFYSQLNCSDKECVEYSPKLKDLVFQLKKKINGIQGHFSILAHSWGTLLFFEYLKDPEAKIPQEFILVNPTPLTAQGFHNAVNNINSRFNREELKELEKLGNDVSNCEAFIHFTFQKYTYKRRRVPFDFKKANCFLGRNLFKELSSYDHSFLLKRTPTKTLVITGIDDPFLSEMELETKVIEKSGHFPFMENPDQFFSTLDNFLTHNQN